MSSIEFWTLAAMGLLSASGLSNLPYGEFSELAFATIVGSREMYNELIHGLNDDVYKKFTKSFFSRVRSGATDIVGNRVSEESLQILLSHFKNE